VQSKKTPFFDPLLMSFDRLRGSFQALPIFPLTGVLLLPRGRLR